MWGDNENVQDVELSWGSIRHAVEIHYPEEHDKRCMHDLKLILDSKLIHELSVNQHAYILSSFNTDEGREVARVLIERYIPMLSLEIETANPSKLVWPLSEFFRGALEKPVERDERYIKDLRLALDADFILELSPAQEAYILSTFYTAEGREQASRLIDEYFEVQIDHEDPIASDSDSNSEDENDPHGFDAFPTGLGQSSAA